MTSVLTYLQWDVTETPMGREREAGTGFQNHLCRGYALVPKNTEILPRRKTHLSSY